VVSCPQEHTDGHEPAFTLHYGQQSDHFAARECVAGLTSASLRPRWRKASV
jgi:hypothetical protein